MTVVLAGAIVLGGAGAALAYFTSTGSGSGTGSVGTASNWAVTNVATSGGALYPGTGSNAVSADVQNPGSANQGLSALTVTVDAPTNTDSSGNYSGEAACTAADFALSGTGWVISNGGDTATYSNATPVDIAAGDYVISDADGGATAGNALPSLTLTMNDLSHAQDQCQGATTNVTVAAS